MNISYLKISGFRGVKKYLEIKFPRGFVIICGRNGSGKSTICDAIEYAITGTIKANSQHKEKGETIFDYLWWKGDSSNLEKYVEIRLNDSLNNELIIRRNVDGLFKISKKDIIDFISEKEISPQNCAEALCNTMILRDEDITRLSVDLPETERFLFAKNAIGEFNFQMAEEKAMVVCSILENENRKLDIEYDKIREKISSNSSILSDLKTQAIGSIDINNVHKEIIAILGDPTIKEENLLNKAINFASKFRHSIDGLTIVLKKITSLKEIDELSNTINHINRFKTINQEIKALNGALEKEKLELTEINKEIKNLQLKEPLTVKIAELHRLGIELGLKDGHCPLCGSPILKENYETHLKQLEESLKKSSILLSNLIKERNIIAERIRRNEEYLLANQNELVNVEKRKNLVMEDLKKIQEEANSYNYKESITLSQNCIESITSYINTQRNKVVQLEKQISVLESSRAYDHLHELETEIKMLQKKSDELSERKNKVNTRFQKVKNSVNTIRRLSGEIVDEQLSELSPLISELYWRLRPHVDWEDIKYHLRGDVRRFLSLQIGDNYNPSFMFSSGQRRAVGLSFLLAVYLSRPWAKLQTLILDDPVQHIDDFRALHLTEILSSVRQLSRQVICTVEDPALADLLSRRLRSNPEEGGILVNLEYVSGEGVKIASLETIDPLNTTQLLAV